MRRGGCKAGRAQPVMTAHRRRRLPASCPPTAHARRRWPPAPPPCASRPMRPRACCSSRAGRWGRRCRWCCTCTWSRARTRRGSGCAARPWQRACACAGACQHCTACFCCAGGARVLKAGAHAYVAQPHNHARVRPHAQVVCPHLGASFALRNAAHAAAGPGLPGLEVHVLSASGEAVEPCELLRAPAAPTARGNSGGGGGLLPLALQWQEARAEEAEGGGGGSAGQTAWLDVEEAAGGRVPAAAVAWLPGRGVAAAAEGAVRVPRVAGMLRLAVAYGGAHGSRACGWRAWWCAGGSGARALQCGRRRAMRWRRAGGAGGGGAEVCCCCWRACGAQSGPARCLLAPQNTARP